MKKNNSLDLTLGSPVIFEDFWSKNTMQSTLDIKIFEDTQYCQSDNFIISDSFESVIRNVFEEKFPFLKDFKLIIGNGASDIIRNLFTILNFKKILIQTPCWGNYFELAKKFNVSLTNDYNDSVDVEIVTIINNPDNKIQKAQTNAIKIYDACYALEQYGFNESDMPTDGEIYIFSLSKLTGHASTRVGFAFVKKDTLFEQIRENIFIGSLGVSRSSQLVAKKCLETYLNKKSEFNNFVKDILTERHKQLEEILKEKIISRRGGVFAYINLDSQELKDKYGILGVSSNYFGDNNINTRINLACKEKDFLSLLEILKKDFS